MTKPRALPDKSREVVQGINHEAIKAEELIRQALAFNRLDNREAVAKTLLEIARPVSRITRSSDVLIAGNPAAALDILEPPKLTDNV